MTVCIALWAILYSIWQTQTSRTGALFFMRFAMVPCYYIPAAFLLFAKNVSDENPQGKISRLYWIVPTFFALATATPWMIQDVVPRLFFPYWPEPGFLMHFCIVLFNLTVIYSFYVLFSAWAKATGSRRWQLKWITLSTLCMWAGGLTNWFLWYNIPIPPIPNFFVAVFLLLLAYAIIRHRLFDVDALADIVREAKLSALGMMAASLNHELRNPLFVAKGKIESQLDAIGRNLYASSEEEAGRSRAVLESAHNQLVRAMDIMQRFSNFARPHADSQSKEEVGLREVAEDVLKLVSSEFEMKKIVVADFSINGECINANRRQVEEIFFNLMMNACQAMGEGGGALGLHVSQPNDKVIVEISDSGPGIPKENLNRIFEPFYSTKAEKGTGLGLYITKQLVERNGGKISVKSKPGQGTTFALEFKR